MSFVKRIIVLCLSIAMAVQLLPLNVMAAKNETQVSEDEKNVTITAHAKETVTVKEKEDSPFEPIDGSLSISSEIFEINRDYEQNCKITVTNLGNETKQFYLKADNDKYPDLSYQFIGDGSLDAPMLIAAGESVTVTLSVFAQNAEKDTYYIPTTAYVLEHDEYAADAKCSVTLNCELADLDLSWKLDSSSKTSLSQTYTITNKGNKLTDLAIKASDELKDYVSFSPILSNYELAAGGSIQFKVFPDLAKMKKNNIKKLTGKIIAFCGGKTSEHECEFDTEGKEITTTTMGKLALKQDGNPFTEFKVKEDSVEFQYYDGSKYVDMSDGLSLENIISDEGVFNIKNDMQVDLGIEKPLSITSTVKTFPVNDSSEKTIETEFEELPDGSVQLTIRNIINASEFWEYLNTLQTRNKKAAVRKKSLILKKYPETLDDKVKLGTEFVVTFNDALDVAKECNLPGALGGNDSIGVLGFIYDIYEITDGACKTTKVFHDPRLSNDVKQKYLTYNLSKVVLTELQWLSALVVPVPANFVLNSGLYLLSKYLDGKQEALLENAYAEIYAQMEGHQCTNRGSVTSKFYAPDYSNSPVKPSMYASSRMSGGGYVNKQDTNYDLKLNDKPVGTTQNSGLTDVLITEIPSNNLLPGEENTIVFDYDTSPGSHSVTTDTEITLLYPTDTEIAYIGEPDDLRDVRTKPDFAVYSENIYADDPIIGEETKLHFNIYNTGSCGGWFTIVCKDAETDETVYTKENYYLSAFSSKQFTTTWTPKKESTKIEVELINTSVGLEERDKYAPAENSSNVRDDRNNHAEQSISARKRLVPKIQSVSSNHIYENEPFSVIVNLTECSDLVDAVFTYEGKKLSTENTGSGENRRYGINFDKGMLKGKYKINAKLKYKSSATEEEISKESFNFTVLKRPLIEPYTNATSSTLLYGKKLEFSVFDTDNLTRTEITVDSGDKLELEPLDNTVSDKDYAVDMAAYSTGEHTILISMYYNDYDGKELVKSGTITVKLLSEKDSYYTFSLSEGIAKANPNFAVYRNSYSKSDVLVDAADNGYRFLKTLDMVDRPSDYSLVVTYDSGVIVKGLDTDNHLIDETGCHTLSVAKTDKAQIEYAAITKLPGDDDDSVTIPVTLDAPVSLSSGIYGLSIRGNVDGVSFRRNINVDVSENNQEIDLSSFALIYYLDAAHAGSSIEKYNARLCFYSEYGWDYVYMDVDSDSENNILKCYTSDKWAMSKMDKSKQVYLLVYSGTEIYFVPIKDESKELEQEKDMISLDKSALKKVSIISKNKNFSVDEASIIWNGLSIALRGDSFYISSGEYKLRVGLTDGNQTFFSEQAVNISGDCEVNVGEDIDVTYSNVTVKWSDVFDKTSKISCYNASKNWNSVCEVGSGSKIKTLDGESVFKIALTCQGLPVIFSKEMNVKGDDKAIEIGDDLEGEFPDSFINDNGYEVGDSLYFSISNVSDSNGNKLYEYDAPLKGELVYTNIKNADKKYYIPVNTDSLYGINANVPNEPGTYSVDIKLNFDFPKEELMYNVTINDSYADISGAGKYKENAVVTINAGKRDNYEFTGWTSSDVTFNNSKSAKATFIMPAKDVAVTAQWKYNGNPSPKPNVKPSISPGHGGGSSTVVNGGGSSTGGSSGGSSTGGSVSTDSGKGENHDGNHDGNNGNTLTTDGKQNNGNTPTADGNKTKLTLKEGSAVIEFKVIGTSGNSVAISSVSKDSKKVIIPSRIKNNKTGKVYNVTKVRKGAFKNCSKLKSLVIGSNVSVIGAEAFEGCKVLANITNYNTSLSKIGKRAFRGIKKGVDIRIEAKNQKRYQKVKKLFQKAGVKKAKFKYRIK